MNSACTPVDSAHAHVAPCVNVAYTQCNESDKSGVCMHDLLHLLRTSVQRAEKAWASSKAPGGVTLAQYLILRAVADEPGLSQTQLSERTGIDRSTTADIIKRMCGRFLLKRERGRLAGEDMRAYSVGITAKGESALEAAETASGRANALLVSHLPKTQVEALEAALMAISTGFDRAA